MCMHQQTREGPRFNATAPRQPHPSSWMIGGGASITACFCTASPGTWQMSSSEADLWRQAHERGKMALLQSCATGWVGRSLWLPSDRGDVCGVYWKSDRFFTSRLALSRELSSVAWWWSSSLGVLLYARALTAAMPRPLCKAIQIGRRFGEN